jgi:hypothetical protein
MRAIPCDEKIHAVYGRKREVQRVSRRFRREHRATEDGPCQLLRYRIYSKNRIAGNRIQTITRGDGIATACLLHHQLRYVYVKSRPPFIPPVPRKLLMRRGYPVSALSCGQVADDTGFDVRLRKHRLYPTSTKAVPGERRHNLFALVATFLSVRKPHAKPRRGCSAGYSSI